MSLKIISVFLFGLVLASQAYAGEIELVKVSPSEQQAVIKNDDGHLKVITVGDRIGEDTIVLGVSKDTVFIKNIREGSIRKITSKSNR